MMIVLYIRRLQHHHPVMVFLLVLMVLPQVPVPLNLEEKPKKIKSVAYVATEHLDTTLMPFHANLAKLSFGAMPSKEWYVTFVNFIMDLTD